MSTSRFFIIIITVSTCRAGIGSIALLCTGRSGYCILIFVTERRKCCLCYDHLITYGAMRTFGKSGFGTCCIYSSIDYFSMTEFVDYCLRNNNSITYRAMLTFCQTGCGTGRCYCRINNLGVAERSFCLSTADGTFYILKLREKK